MPRLMHARGGMRQFHQNHNVPTICTYKSQCTQLLTIYTCTMYTMYTMYPTTHILYLEIRIYLIPHLGIIMYPITHVFLKWRPRTGQNRFQPIT